MTGPKNVARQIPMYRSVPPSRLRRDLAGRAQGLRDGHEAALEAEVGLQVLAMEDDPVARQEGRTLLDPHDLRKGAPLWLFD